jgi:hypothetical protein
LVETDRIAAGAVGCNPSVLILKSTTAGASPDEIVSHGATGPWPKVASLAMIGANVMINLNHYSDMRAVK